MGVRVSATDWMERGWTPEETVVFARELKKLGCDYVDVSSGALDPRQQIALAPGYQVPFAEKVRREAGIATMAVGLISGARQAEDIIARGQADFICIARGAMWNSGMFVWKASAILREIQQHLPEVHAVLQDMLDKWRSGEIFEQVVQKQFHRMPAISIDVGVLEKCANVGLVPSEIGWSDVGSWDAVYEIAGKDENNNNLQGNVLALDCKNSLIRGDKRLVAAIGMEDIFVVETPDAILITKRGQSQRVREVVEALQQRGAREQMTHVTVQRPWGSYTILEDENSGFKIKRITVIPGGKLSLQSHQHRSEHWVVVSGTATVVHGEDTRTVTKNESTYIPIGVKHRLENRGVIPLQIIEVQVGEYLEEDDIHRFDDHYGRS